MQSNVLFKALKLLCFIVPISLVLLLLHVIYFLDPSIQPAPELSEAQKSVNIHLISYADGAEFYRQNQNILAMSAINRGVDFIYNYRRHNIDADFIRHHPILNERIGAGFWLWKPYLILETLKKIPEGDILIYADTGFLIRQDIRDFFTRALGDKDILLFACDPKDYGFVGTIASGDVFEALHCHEKRCRYGHHLEAGLLVLRNSPHSRTFIQKWLRVCQKTELLKTGHTHNAPSFPEFSHHQHDQSLLSVLATREAEAIHFMRMDPAFFKYINMHRRKDNHRSLIGCISVQYRGIVRQWLDAEITHSLQSYLVKILDKGNKVPQVIK